MKNPLKTVANRTNFWKTIQEKTPCPQCNGETFIVAIEEKVVNPRNLPELFGLEATKRTVIVCVNCKKRFYSEEFVK
ncbi:MAG: hypothetical protein NWE98_01990 [Candidatus Bathyarchaeota archaeon]|nr:hypothetical protein [Candidatus Bathyarchaeota archaeon]